MMLSIGRGNRLLGAATTLIASAALAGCYAYSPLGIATTLLTDQLSEQVDADDLIDGDVDWTRFGVVTGLTAIDGQICIVSSIRLRSEDNDAFRKSIHIQDGLEIFDSNANERRFLPLPPGSYRVTEAECTDGDTIRTFSVSPYQDPTDRFSPRFDLNAGQVVDIGIVEFQSAPGSSRRGRAILKPNDERRFNAMAASLGTERDRAVSWQDEHRRMKKDALRADLDAIANEPEFGIDAALERERETQRNAAVYFGSSQSEDWAESSLEFIWAAYSDVLAGVRPVTQAAPDPKTGLDAFHMYGTNVTRAQAQEICQTLNARGENCEVANRSVR